MSKNFLVNRGGEAAKYIFDPAARVELATRMADLPVAAQVAATAAMVAGRGAIETKHLVGEFVDLAKQSRGPKG